MSSRHRAGVCVWWWGPGGPAPRAGEGGEAAAAAGGGRGLAWRGGEGGEAAAAAGGRGPAPGAWSPVSGGQPPRPYLGQVLGDATPAVGVGDLRVLQVHNPLAHVLVEQDSPVVTPCGEGGWRVRPEPARRPGPWRRRRLEPGWGAGSGIASLRLSSASIKYGCNRTFLIRVCGGL